jgi:tetratricopeptide (TPR) repeat protein
MGYTSNGVGTQNLLLALDSAATVVEKIAPQCKELVAPYRSRFFTELHNKFVASINADKVDSASYFAHLEAQLAVNDPRTWNDLSAVFAKQEKPDSAMIAMDRIITLSGTDTVYKKIKQQSRYNLAVINLTRAETSTGANKDAQIKLGRSLLEDYLKDSPGEATAQQALGRALRLAGDTTAVKAIFGDMITAPDRFTDLQLFEAASNAASSGRDQDAVMLFENGLKKNPYHRVALLNLSNVLFQLKDVEKMRHVSERLLSIDPNSPDSWRMHAGYWQLKQRAETDPAKKKAFGDSTLAAIGMRDKVNPRIDVSSASRAGAAYQIQGTLTNDGEKSASWTVKFELLDATGAVVATKEVAVGPIEKGSAASFSLKVDAPKAIAYRYAPVR